MLCAETIKDCRLPIADCQLACFTREIFQLIDKDKSAIGNCQLAMEMT